MHPEALVILHIPKVLRDRVLALDGRPVWFAHIKEVRSESTHREFHDVGDGLLDGTAQEAGNNGLVAEEYDGVYTHFVDLARCRDPLVGTVDKEVNAFCDNDLKERIFHKLRCKT